MSSLLSTFVDHFCVTGSVSNGFQNQLNPIQLELPGKLFFSLWHMAYAVLRIRSRTGGSPGSGSGSISPRYGSGSFYLQAKLVRKTLIPTILWLLYDFLSLKSDVNVTLKSNNKKTLKFFSHLDGHLRKAGSVSQRCGSRSVPVPICHGSATRAYWLSTSPPYLVVRLSRRGNDVLIFFIYPCFPCRWCAADSGVGGEGYCIRHGRPLYQEQDGDAGDEAGLRGRRRRTRRLLCRRQERIHRQENGDSYPLI